MWVTLFALGTAVSVWFSAANLAVQLRKDQAVGDSVIESRGQTRIGTIFLGRFNTGPAAVQFD